MLENISNYFMYAPIAENKPMSIKTGEITAENWDSYYYGLLNIMKDGIETDQVQKCMIDIVFPTKDKIQLNIPHLFLNMILWYPVVALKHTIGPEHLFFSDTFTAGDVKKYIDKHVIMPHRLTVPNKLLNNIIADTLVHFIDVDNFAMYIADTLNLEDDIDLMENSKEFKDLLHCDLSGVPIEKVKDAGMEVVNKAIKIIMDSKNIIGYNHCLRNAFAAHEGINIRQYKENHYNIGTKPDGQGSIYHNIINQSYVTGGLNNMMYQIIDSGSSRVAQIISKKNVGESGGFSRILGLNNMGSFLNKDPHYDCGTRNFEHIFIPNKEVLKRLYDRYYRFDPNGVEYKIKEGDDFLIGKKIYLRSPITCASRAQGNGVCYKCYGDLAYTNADINIGRIATEIITSQYTQKRLSAKHLLETLIDEINWNEEFRKFLIVETNAIKLGEADEDFWMKFKLIIDPEQIQLENDEDFFQHKFYTTEANTLEDEGPFYNEYLTEFIIENIEDGTQYKIGSIPSEEFPEAKMYFSTELVTTIREIVKKNKQEEIEDDTIQIPMNLLEDKVLFYIKIQNNDLGKNLDIFNDLINKRAVTKSYTKDQLLEKLIETLIRGGIDCQSIHLETIMSNQIKNPLDRLQECNWLNPDEPYELLTLNEALTDNPSIINSLIYQKLAKVLYYPLSFKKTAPSIFDPFFMQKPKKFLHCDHEIWDETNVPTRRPGESPIFFVKDHDGPRPKNVKAIIDRFSDREKTELDD